MKALFRALVGRKRLFFGAARIKNAFFRLHRWPLGVLQTRSAMIVQLIEAHLNPYANGLQAALAAIRQFENLAAPYLIRGLSHD